MNDPPSFSASNLTITVMENTGLYNESWASNITPGPEEAGQTLTFSVDCESTPSKLFAAGPSVSATGYLSFTPAANTAGSANCVVTLSDAGGLNDTSTLKIVVMDGKH